MRDLTITYHDDGADRWGRRHFTLEWVVEGPRVACGLPIYDEQGVEVAHQRAQVFHTEPSRFADAEGYQLEGQHGTSVGS